ncbi:uncharacterized protein [Drosophila bipectinata]|uniref:uncharacterized protein isoform X1 n=1 Tax=Drosophila bipectinata TaxID=42026 RepID=UPI001C899CCB|nr:uncharacterized protein LOC108118798 isoform X1 [Drosophila bipectinata]
MNEACAFNENEEDEQKYAHLLNSDYFGGASQSALESSTDKRQWKNEELELFLGVIYELKLQSQLHGKRNSKVFKVIAKEMGKKGCSKSAQQLQTKYHQLRKQFVRARNGGEPFEHFEALHELFQASGASDLEPEPDSDSEAEMDEDMAGLGSETEGDDTLDASSSTMHVNARCKWTEGEVDMLLDLIITMGLRRALLSKRNAKVFRALAKEMAKRNCNKGPDKLRIKFQLLRRMYNKVKNGTGETFEHFEAMRQVLDPTPEEAAVGDADANLSSASETEFNDSEDDDGDPSQRGAHFWSDEEVDAFLLVIRDNGFFRALDGSRKRNFQTLVHISNILAKQSFKRTPHQLRNKLRMLLKRHREAKEHGLENVRILPRHFELFDELIKTPHETPKSATQRPNRPIKTFSSKPSRSKAPPETDSDESSSTCDLLRAAGESEDFEDGLDAVEGGQPTPMEAITTIMEGQKQLLNLIKSSNESFLRQQRAQQQEFLEQVSELMRRDREETLRRIEELLPPK